MRRWLSLSAALALVAAGCSGAPPPEPSVPLSQLGDVVVSAISFPTLGDGYALDGDLQPDAVGRGVAATHDGGGTWRLVAAQSAFAPFLRLAGVAFADPSHGWAWATDSARKELTSRPNLFATIDGGRHWVTTFSPPSKAGVESLRVVGASVWVVTGASTTSLWVSEDRGATWRRASAPGGCEFSDLSIVSATEAATLCSGGIGQTSDGARTWTVEGTPLPAPYAKSGNSGLFAASSPGRFWWATEGQLPVGCRPSGCSGPTTEDNSGTRPALRARPATSSTASW